MLSKTLLSAALLIFASTSQAARTFEKDIKISDGTGGELTIHSEGSMDNENSTHLSEGAFRTFRLNPGQPGTIDGFINREAIRDSDVADITYDADLTLSGAPANGSTTPRTTKVVFSDLKVQRSEEGVSFIGVIYVDGNAVDANAAPRWVRGMVARLARLFRL